MSMISTSTKTVERWLSAKKDVPGWLPVTLALLPLDGAQHRAGTVAQYFNKENTL